MSFDRQNLLTLSSMNHSFTASRVRGTVSESPSQICEDAEFEFPSRFWFMNLNWCLWRWRPLWAHESSAHTLGLLSCRHCACLFRQHGTGDECVWPAEFVCAVHCSFKRLSWLSFKQKCYTWSFLLTKMSPTKLIFLPKRQGLCFLTEISTFLFVFKTDNVFISFVCIGHVCLYCFIILVLSVPLWKRSLSVLLVYFF